MLTVQNVSYYLGDRALYEDASLHIKPKDKIGLIGANGTGKSTLLKIIAGEITPDEGIISKSKDCTIGFLNQDLLSFKSEDSILSVVMQAFERENHLWAEMDKLTKQLETEYTDQMIERLGKLQEEYDVLGGYSVQSKAEEILEGLGFITSDLQKPLELFSGGWRMRVILGKMLLMQPSLLLLDEPTNHLDLPSIEWLEKYIKGYGGAVVIVSHDQDFLNNCVGLIAEVAYRDINLYVGNYDKYLEERELRREIQKSAFQNQQKKIKETEQFIERFKAKASKAKQAQSRVKALEKMERVEDIVEENKQINFHFNITKESGKIVLELKDIAKSYGDKLIFKNSNVTIMRGDKIAMIGANGKGKSTLLRIIEGRESYEGERNEGHNVLTSMYAQHQLEDLNTENEILTELQQMGIEKTELELRTVLGAFLFYNDDVYKKIKVLSGGERSRVALAKTLISEANFLLLDEPTNHLDILSVNMLMQALEQYNGTYVAISHDRYFIKNVANKIWFIEDHELKQYPGTYSEYMDWMENRRTKETSAAAASQKLPGTKTKKEEKPRHEPKPSVNKKAKYVEGEIQKLEDKIEKKENAKATLEEEMAKPEVFSDFELLAKKTQELEKINTEIETFHKEWEGLHLQLEEIENE